MTVIGRSRRPESDGVCGRNQPIGKSVVNVRGVVEQEVLRGAVCVDEKESKEPEVNVGCLVWSAAGGGGQG